VEEQVEHSMEEHVEQSMEKTPENRVEEQVETSVEEHVEHSVSSSMDSCISDFMEKMIYEQVDMSVSQSLSKNRKSSAHRFRTFREKNVESNDVMHIDMGTKKGMGRRMRKKVRKQEQEKEEIQKKEKEETKETILKKKKKRVETKEKSKKSSDEEDLWLNTMVEKTKQERENYLTKMTKTNVKELEESITESLMVIDKIMNCKVIDKKSMKEMEGMAEKLKDLHQKRDENETMIETESIDTPIFLSIMEDLSRLEKVLIIYQKMIENNEKMSEESVDTFLNTSLEYMSQMKRIHSAKTSNYELFVTLMHMKYKEMIQLCEKMIIRVPMTLIRNVASLSYLVIEQMVVFMGFHYSHPDFLKQTVFFNKFAYVGYIPKEWIAFFITIHKIILQVNK
jgi:hypothetical protein